MSLSPELHKASCVLSVGACVRACVVRSAGNVCPSRISRAMNALSQWDWHSVLRYQPALPAFEFVTWSYWVPAALNQTVGGERVRERERRYIWKTISPFADQNLKHCVDVQLAYCGYVFKEPILLELRGMQMTSKHQPLIIISEIEECRWHITISVLDQNKMLSFCTQPHSDPIYINGKGHPKNLNSFIIYSSFQVM